MSSSFRCLSTSFLSTSWLRLLLLVLWRLLGFGVLAPFPLRERLRLWLRRRFVSGTLRFFFWNFLCGEPRPAGGCTLCSLFSSVFEVFDGEKVRDWLRDRRRHRPRRVVEPVEGIWTGGVFPELRRRLRPRASSSASIIGVLAALTGEGRTSAMVWEESACVWRREMYCGFVRYKVIMEWRKDAFQRKQSLRPTPFFLLNLDPSYRRFVFCPQISCHIHFLHIWKVFLPYGS